MALVMSSTPATRDADDLNVVSGATNPFKANEPYRVPHAHPAGSTLKPPLPHAPTPSTTPSVVTNLRLDPETTRMLENFEGRQRVEAAAIVFSAAANANVAVGQGELPSSSHASRTSNDRVVSLVGITPHGLHQSYLGVFEQREEIVNGCPSYAQGGTPAPRDPKQDADERIMMWFSPSLGWVCGDAKFLGKKEGGVIRAVDVNARLPELVKPGAWRVAYQAPGIGGKGAEGITERQRGRESSKLEAELRGGERRWLDASELSCIKGFLV